MRHSITALSLTLLLVSACSAIPPSAYQTPTTPESLLDVSQEVVTIDAVGSTTPSELSSLLESNTPSRVVVACNPEVGACKRAIRVLDQYGVPYETAMEGPGIQLHFETVLAHDCEQGFLSNHINPYNFNHASMGCSVAANTVQMVSDRRQFTSPVIQGPARVDRVTRIFKDYNLYPPPAAGQSFNQILQSSGGS